MVGKADAQGQVQGDREEPEEAGKSAPHMKDDNL
jgi:hypothetical protein